MPLASIDEILKELAAGRAIVLVDDERRENEGDFVVAAEKITPEMVNFLTRVGGGYLCVALDGSICTRLELDLAPSRNNARSTAFTVSVEGHPRHGIGSGVSAKDRSTTIRLLSDPASGPADFTRPGHVNPLRAREGGVLVRTGQTEGSVDLCRLAGLQPAAAIIEIVKPDGEMARMPELKAICAEHKLKMCSVEQVIQWRLAREEMVSRVEPLDGEELQTPEGLFRLFAWRSPVDALPHIAFTTGGVGRLGANGSVIKQSEPTLVRMHRRDIFSDVFGTQKDSRNGSASGQDEIRAALRLIAQEGRGALVYLRTEGSGFDLPGRLQRIQRPGHDDPNAPDLTRPDGIAASVHPVDLREIGVGGQILRDLGLTKLRLLTNHPKGSMPGLHAFGLDIVDQVKL
ncbi:MAG: 3,4-dihydroxy-2-butanone-4-phosphate synthase [Planctomycetes bacterium]|nr:3,4-dihydroxy-2-butanone-4-phosphate synthase [Planctomycetota bacterium]